MTTNDTEAHNAAPAAEPLALSSSAGLGLAPEREAFDLHDCAMGYAYTESTDPAGPDEWSTDDVVKAFKAGYELAQRHERAAVAAERERCVQIALDAPMVEPPLEDDPPEVDTAMKSMAVSIVARIRGLEPMPRHGEQTALDLKA